MQTDSLTTPRSFDFTSYKKYLAELAAAKTCTGELSPEHIEATMLNSVRVNRIDKQIQLKPACREILSALNEKWEWIVLIESWCGDGAQNLPVIAKIAAASPGISLKILLRDENPELMDANLTNGARAIPKLICRNKTTGKTIGTWGPRPEAIRQKVLRFKSENPDAPQKDFSYNLQHWYALDKGESLQDEFIGLLPTWIKNSKP